MIRRFLATPMILIAYLFLYGFLCVLWFALVVVLGKEYGSDVWHAYADCMPSLTLARDDEGNLVALITRVK